MGVGPVGIVVRVRQQHDGPRRLCEPVGLDELAAERAQRSLQHLFGYRRRAVKDGNEAREVGLLDSRCHQQELQYRGHEHRVGDAVAGDELDDLRGVDLAHHDVDRPEVQADERPEPAGDVEHRHGHEAHRLFVEPEHLADRVGGREQVGVREHDALRAARGS